jgi:hypothetical protein
MMSGFKWYACTALLCTGLAHAQATAPIDHFGMCNASAAVLVGKDRFLVADDNDNILRLYDTDRSSTVDCNAQADNCFDQSAALDLDGQKKKWEVDIEGAAQIGNRIYWIGSHGTNTKGEPRPKRRQIFATDIDATQGKVNVTWVGRYTRLLEAMDADPSLKKYKLLDAAEKTPEKKHGLNIEGLAASPAGYLLIGLRGPLFKDKALVVTLKNPQALMTASPALQFDAPVELQLGKRGIRSIEYAPNLHAYLIVAGSEGSKEDFKLYKWSGDRKAKPEPLNIELPRGFRPEALFALADGVSFKLLSDDGDNCDGKFRSITIKP